MQSINDVIDEAITFTDVKIITIKSELEKFFCAGANVMNWERLFKHDGFKVLNMIQNVT